jgi:hypothetical protein
MRAVLQTLQQQQAPPPQSRLGEFLRTRPNTFSQSKDHMDIKDWLKSVKKKLEIAQCTDCEKVLFCGAPVVWNCSHPNVEAIT